MFAVGRLGTYITRGVNTVSGPFHPFGGAVDIVVVEQQDGSFKTSPWYVRFGKFQGVLKANEKVVKISVNGVEANFHMYLDHRGGAYFLRDVDEEVDSILLSSSSGEETIGQLSIREPIESKICNYEADLSNFVAQIDVMNGNVLSRSSSQRSRILGLVFGRNSVKKDRVGRVDSLERAEIAADLLELKWSTNFTPERYPKDSGSHFSAIDIVHDEENKDFRINDGESEAERSCLSIGTSSFGESAFQGNNDLKVNCCNSFFDDMKILGSERISVNTNSIVSETYSEMVNVLPVNGSVKELESCCVIKSSSFSNSICVDQEERSTSEEDEENMLGPVCDSREYSEAKSISPPVGHEEEQFFFGDLDAFNLGEIQTMGSISQDHTEEEEYFSSNFESNSSPDRFFEESLPNDVEGLVQKSNIISSQFDIAMKNEVAAQGVGLIVESLPIMFSQCDELSTHHLNSARDLSGENSLESTRGMDVENYVPNPTAIKKKIRVLTPTSEQLASLNLKEGKNIVTFTFSTAVMGKQQVNARIYLWRWDTRIVISDVDGTITKSDLLGQFMPLVGQDWSQTGVAHFFSAIKENGYQMIFLSARSISQAYHTRQFLINLKQDGKALPDGPVLISPDGLFPSLFREVIRRAPHEFKIGCLEDIRALFPSDRNPFYAGFGNRDSDEISYLKVGIPKGKIFIINPKGEVVVNHRVDSKSYNSLQALVNGMFPPMFSSEQEGFNSWNYWKLPPLAIDI